MIAPSRAIVLPSPPEARQGNTRSKEKGMDARIPAVACLLHPLIPFQLPFQCGFQ